MSGNGKVLELIAIQQDDEKWHLHTRIISIGQQMEVLWEVDAYTADHLTALCDFSGNHKYRLSFKTSVDSAKSQITSTVSKTYRDISNRLSFICSTEYQKQLEEIKEIGYDEKLVESDDFKAFSNKFSSETSLKDIAEMYGKLNDIPKEAEPFNPRKC